MHLKNIGRRYQAQNTVEKKMNSEKLHVLVIPTWYPDGKDKLMGQYHRNFTASLNDTGLMEANMLYIFRNLFSKPISHITEKKESVRKDYNYWLYERKILNVSPISFKLEMSHYTKAVIKEFNRYCKDHGKPDIIHAQVSVPAGYSSCVLGAKYGIPVVMTEHASYFERFFTGDESTYQEYTLKNSKITCVGSYMKDIYKKHGYDADVLPNEVDTSLFHPRKEVKSNDNKTIKIITVCAFRDEKRVDDVLKAVRMLKDEGYDIKYTAVGDGDYSEKYHKVAEDLSLNDTVTFTGQLNSHQIADLLPGNTALIVSSEIETFGIPAIEALSSGIPVISSTCEGTNDIIDEGCGIFYKTGDIKELKNAILTIWNNSKKYSAANCIKAAEKFSSKSVAMKAYKIYNDLLVK
jgi:glycosyltransferase involved in cell wall biosynthesis